MTLNHPCDARRLRKSSPGRASNTLGSHITTAYFNTTASHFAPRTRFDSIRKSRIFNKTFEKPANPKTFPLADDYPDLASLNLSSNAIIFDIQLPQPVKVKSIDSSNDTPVYFLSTEDLDAESRTASVEERPPAAVYTKYKPVAKRVVPIQAHMPEEFRIKRTLPDDPLEGMLPLPTNPPPFEPGERYTQERHDAQNVNPEGHMTEQEVELVHWIMRQCERALAWDESEKGRFKDEFFPPIRIPTVDHIPWTYRNIPIPPGLLARVIDIIKSKIAAGSYEPSTSSYRSQWFTVLKKDGTSLRIVHDLQPLNKVTIRDASLVPDMDQLATHYAGRTCYGVLDLFVAFDQRTLHEDSRDMTTFQTPLGAFRLTVIPMGATNSVQIMQGDVCHALQAEIPEFTLPYVDDVGVRGPESFYLLPDGSFETISANKGIQRFVWEHLNNFYRILWRMKVVGATFSGPKLRACVLRTTIVGHEVSFEGRLPDEKRVAVIKQWPPCKTVKDVQSLLGTAGVMRVFIKNYSQVCRPLQKLLRKDIDFVWEAEHQHSMDALKKAFIESPALRSISYSSGLPVILLVDSSMIAVGFVLLQLGGRWEALSQSFRVAALQRPRVSI